MIPNELPWHGRMHKYRLLRHPHTAQKPLDSCSHECVWICNAVKCKGGNGTKQNGIHT